MSLHRFHDWFRAAPARRMLGLLVGVTCGVTVLLAQTVDDGPVPIRRIPLKPEQALKELEKVQTGALLLFPQQEFDARLERLRKAAQARAEKPRLTRAHYSAELIDRAFTNGSGLWTIQHAGAEAAILPIDSLSLALAKVKWERGSDAILWDADGKSLALLVKPAGTQTCLFDWSARGIPNNDGIAFTLAVPPCPVSTFELKVPADSWLSVAKGNAIVTGPHDTESPDKRLWKLQITGQKQIDLAVRKIVEPKGGPAAALFARVHSKQDLGPERIAIEHEFQIDFLHGAVEELILDGDATLQPYNVVLKSREVKNSFWTVVPAKKDAKGKTLAAPTGFLTIQFQQPVQGKLQDLRVFSLAARPAGAVWTSPALRVRNAVSRGETLELHLRPDMPLGKWDAGSFQPTAITTGSDGAPIITLVETALAAGSRRPALIMPVPGNDLYTTEHYQWHIANRTADLKAEILYTLARGNVTELNLKVPPAFTGYQVESLEVQPPDLLRGWHPSGDLVVVELKQALTPTRKATLKLHLRANYRELAAGTRILNYPELLPIDSVRREGTVAIFVDPAFQAQVVTSSVPLGPSDPGDGKDSRKSAASNFLFTFRDQRVTASLRLTPPSVQVQWRGRHTVRLAEQEAALQFHWEVEPLVGAPDFVDLRFAPGFPPVWKLTTEEGAPAVHHWERLQLADTLPHLLTLGAGVQAALPESALPTGAQWRFHFAEPLRKKARFTVEATSAAGIVEDEWRRMSLCLPRDDAWALLAGALASDLLPKSAGVKIWSVPLVTPVQRSNVEQEITVDSPLEPIDKAVTDGARAFRLPAGRSEKASLHLKLPEANDLAAEPGSHITLWTHPAKRAASLLEHCDEAKLTTYVCKDGTVYHRAQFRLWHWRDRTCELRFPNSVHIVAAKVHDQWLDRLEVGRDRAGVGVTLPFDQNTPFVRYDVYARAEPGGGLVPGLINVNVPTPAWPVAPIDFRYRACLEDHWLPLDRESMSRVGVPSQIARQSEALRLLQQLWALGESWWPYGAGAERQEKLENQKQAVRLAAAQLRGANANKPLKLGEALERLALTHLKETTPLVIDQVAFRSLGLSAETMVPPSALGPQAERPFWESLGLTYVPCPSGALLTTAGRLQKLGVRPPHATELDDALQEAILHGRDRSAGFYLVLEWLRRRADDVRPFESTSAFPIVEHLGDFQDMAEWEVLPESGRIDSFSVIDPTVGRVAGWLIAFLTALVLWKVHRAMEPTSCFRVHVFMVTAAVLALIWLPATVRELLLMPAVLAIGISFLACLIRLAGRRSARVTDTTPPHPRPSSLVKGGTTSAAALGLLLLGISWSATAQPPTARVYDVYLVDGKIPSVLVTPDLIAKLTELEKQQAGALPGAVLVRAKYTGKVQGGVANIDVQYELQSFKDQTNLVIPLADVQLQEGAFLDGAPVFPTVHEPAGYVLPIRDKGLHFLRLSFSVPVKAGGDHADLKFRIPKLVQNEIALSWSPPVQTVHGLQAFGEEKLTVDPRQAVKEWRAHLGSVNVVHLRWNNTLAAPAPKSVEVKEAHFWDLRPGSLTLWSSLQFSAGKGTLSQLQVALPEGLQVRSVDAPAPAAAGPIVIKHWQVLGKGAQRRLIVDLVQPITGNLVLNVECVPQFGAMQKQLLLSLPGPLQGKSVSGLLGYRLEAEEIRGTAQNLAVQRINKPEDFDQLWAKQGGPAIPAASRAYSFQRKAQQAGLELVIQPNARKAQFSLQWNVDLHHADLAGKFTFTSQQEDLILLEISLDPALTLGNVGGPDVRAWHRQDSVLQVWLRQPRKETTIDIAGWRTLPWQNKAPAKKSLPLPKVFPLNTAFADATLEVRAAAGLHVDVEPQRKLRASPTDRQRYIIEDASYEAAVALRLDSKPPPAFMLTKVQNTPQGVEIWHGIRISTERGRLPGLQLLVKDWPGGSLVLDAPGAAVQPLKEKSAKDHRWTLKYPPGQPQEVFLVLHGRVSADKQKSIALPSIELEGAVVANAWLAWQEVEIVQANGGKKLAAQKKARAEIAVLTSESWLRDPATWNCADAQHSLKVVLPKTPTGSSVRALASTERAWLVDGHWLHEASVWLHAPEAAELRVKFPAALDQFSVLTDGRTQTAWTPANQKFVLPLDAGSEPRLVVMRWTYAQGAERIDAPSIAAIQIVQVNLPAHQRLLTIPPGLALAANDAGTSPTLFARLLHEAETEMRLAETYAQESPGDAKKPVAACQERFFAALRQAEYAMGVAKNTAGDFNAATALKRMKAVRDDNAALAKKHRYERQRDDADKAKKLVAPARTGADRWHAGVPFLVTPGLPSVSLLSLPARADAEKRTWSELFLLVVVFMLVFSFVRHGMSIARLFAPEIAIGLVTAAMFAFGVSMIGLGVIGLLILVRLYGLATHVKQRLTPKAGETTASLSPAPRSHPPTPPAA